MKYMLIILIVSSCRTITTHPVTDHRHLGNGRYYYRLSDSIDYIGHNRGMGRHRCATELKIDMRKVKKGRIDTVGGSGD